MKIQSNGKSLIIAFMVMAIFLLFYSGNAFIKGEMFKESSLIEDNNWRWFAGFVTLIIGVLIGWLTFQKENENMRKRSNRRFERFTFIITSLIILGLAKPIYTQSSESDSSFHPYHVNYLVTGGIIIAGVAAEKIGISWIDKSPISVTELQALDRNNLNVIDRWAFNFNASNMEDYVTLSDQVLSGVVLLPVLTMIDSNIRKDWLDVIMMYLETITLSNNMYLYSPFGPTFQNRMRPVVYYDELGENEIRTRGANRNSFYSGHVASAATASFFTAKVYCDYHPELGWAKYLVYGAASIPPTL